MATDLRGANEEDKADELVRHWTQPQHFEAYWNSRAARAVEFVKDETWICDIGCGMQAVRTLLSPSQVYLPADLRAWTPDTAVCNLNAGDYPLRYLTASDATLMLGVVEYLTAPSHVLMRLSACVRRLVVTYSTTELHPVRNALWINAMSETAFLQLLELSGFAVSSTALIEDQRQILVCANSTRLGSVRRVACLASRARISLGWLAQERHRTPPELPSGP